MEYFFADKEGKVRHEVRVHWWQQNLTTYRNAAMVARAEDALIPDMPLPAQWRDFTTKVRRLFFGHYWFSGTPAVLSSQFACLDYSAARNGPLVAYRWDGEPSLSSEKLAWVS